METASWSFVRSARAILAPHCLERPEGSSRVRYPIDPLAKKIDVLLPVFRRVSQEGRSLNEAERRLASEAIAELERMAFGAGAGSGAEAAQPELERVSAQALCEILGAAIAAKRAEHASLRQAVIAFSAPHDIASAGAEVAADSRELASLARALIEKSIASLGGGVGVVRATLRVGVGSVSISVEDNGRGFSDDMMRKAFEKERKAREEENDGAAVSGASAAERARSLAHAWGGRAESCARLGAGSRVDLELPRIDAAATPRRRAPERGFASAAAYASAAL